MQQNPKLFAEKLNQGLNDLGVPINIRERSIILGRMIHIPKQQAWALLEGHIFPDENLLEQIAIELDVNRDWLLKRDDL